MANDPLCQPHKTSRCVFVESPYSGDIYIYISQYIQQRLIFTYQIMMKNGMYTRGKPP